MILSSHEKYKCVKQIIPFTTIDHKILETHIECITLNRKHNIRILVSAIAIGGFFFFFGNCTKTKKQIYYKAFIYMNFIYQFKFWTKKKKGTSGSGKPKGNGKGTTM